MNQVEQIKSIKERIEFIENVLQSFDEEQQILFNMSNINPRRSVILIDVQHKIHEISALRGMMAYELGNLEKELDELQSTVKPS